jgi:predicted choloylglycine hydrolase
MRAQRLFVRQHCRAECEEIAGIAEGYSLAEDDLLAFLHLGVLSDLDEDGCTAWARRRPECGAIVVKNRDFRSEHAALQCIALHDDPSLPWRYLTLGSFGAPGAYSSGVNETGLAVVDTHTAVNHHQPGWLRYFVMTEILMRDASVAAAIDRLERLPHVGGGCLVLADAEGDLAAIELTADGIAVELHSAAVARTNHFLLRPDAIAMHRTDPMAQSSFGRLARIVDVVAETDARAAKSLMASHAEGDREALCRHGEDGDALTISSVIYQTSPPMLQVAMGPPCETTWAEYSFAYGK